MASASTTFQPSERDRLRNRTFGFIFQFYHLLPELNTLENVLMPRMIGQSMLGWLRNRRRFRSEAIELLERVGLSHRLKHRRASCPAAKCSAPPSPVPWSTGRASFWPTSRPATSTPTTGAEVIRLLRDLNRSDGLTIIMVTHNLDILSDTDRVVRLVEGRVEDPTASPV